MSDFLLYFSIVYGLIESLSLCSIKDPYIYNKVALDNQSILLSLLCLHLLFGQHFHTRNQLLPKVHKFDTLHLPLSVLLLVRHWELCTWLLCHRALSMPIKILIRTSYISYIVKIHVRKIRSYTLNLKT